MSGSASVDFLGIGAQRAATTWLTNTLRTHPDIWMPPRKELHYFTRDPRHRTVGYLSRGRRPTDVLRETLRGSWTGKRIRADVRTALRRRSVNDFRWLYRYWVSEPDDEWYVALFEQAEGRLAGEISPDYALLDDRGVQQVHRLLPDARIIYVMRHPIDRAWSHFRLQWGRRGLDADDVPQVNDFMASAVQTRRSDYVTTVRTWRSVYGDDQVFLGYHDEIAEDQDGWLRRLAGFLGVVPHGFRPAASVNVGRHLAMPAQVELQLAQNFEPMLRALLVETAGAPAVERWLDDCRSIIERGGAGMPSHDDA